MLKDQLRRKIIDRQNTAYESTKFIVFDIGREISGFGCMLDRRRLALQFGEYFSRTVILNFIPNTYADPYNCIGRYSMEDIKNENIVEFAYGDQDDKVVYFNFSSYWKNKNIKSVFYEKSVLGLDFKLFAGVLLNLLEIKDKYKALLTAKMRDINFDEAVPKIGLHIRHGDKEVDSPFIPLSRYLQEVKVVSEITGIKTIYLCSDDGDVYTEVVEGLPGYTIIYDKSETRYNSKKSNARLVFESLANREEETFTALKNIELLTKCTHIIGQSNVQFAKIAGCKCIDLTNNLQALTLINPFSLTNVYWDLTQTQDKILFNPLMYSKV